MRPRSQVGSRPPVFATPTARVWVDEELLCFAYQALHHCTGVVRAVLWFNAPLSYALAFSPIPTRTYVAACAVVLLPLVTMAMLATSWFL